jgi:hypothetical protein
MLGQPNVLISRYVLQQVMFDVRVCSSDPNGAQCTQSQQAEQLPGARLLDVVHCSLAVEAGAYIALGHYLYCFSKLLKYVSDNHGPAYGFRAKAIEDACRYGSEHAPVLFC